MNNLRRIAANENDLPEGVAIAMYLGSFVRPAIYAVLWLSVGIAVGVYLA